MQAEGTASNKSAAAAEKAGGSKGRESIEVPSSFDSEEDEYTYESAYTEETEEEVQDPVVDF